MLLSKFDPNICVTPYLRDFTAHRLYRNLNIQKIENTKTGTLVIVGTFEIDNEGL